MLGRKLQSEDQRRQRENEKDSSQPAQKLQLLSERLMSVLALEIWPVCKSGQDDTDEYDSHHGQVDPEYPVPVECGSDGATNNGTNNDAAALIQISLVSFYGGNWIYLRRERRLPWTDSGVYSRGALPTGGSLPG